MKNVSKAYDYHSVRVTSWSLIPDEPDVRVWFLAPVLGRVVLNKKENKGLVTNFIPFKLELQTH